MGCVAAIAAAKPFPGQDTDWILLFNSVPDNHWKWFRRTGFSLHRTNDDYWTFLIPGVGEAPVVSFLLLVSLFAIVIGPVNYVVLGRSRRLYLLLLTVPAGAAARDPLPVHVRAADGRTGRAAAVAQLYGAGSAHRRGSGLVAAVVLRRHRSVARPDLSERHHRLSGSIRARLSRRQCERDSRQAALGRGPASRPPDT